MSKHRLPLSETDIKSQIKGLLAAYGIFNFPLLQGLGAYRGIPDRVLHIPAVGTDRPGRVVYLEIKRPGGKQSDYQKEFEAQCTRDGVDYWLVSSVEELQEKIKNKEDHA